MIRLLLWGNPPEFTIEREAMRALARYRILNAVMIFPFFGVLALLSSETFFFFIIFSSVFLFVLRARPWSGNTA